MTTKGYITPIPEQELTVIQGLGFLTCSEPGSTAAANRHREPHAAILITGVTASP